MYAIDGDSLVVFDGVLAGAVLGDSSHDDLAGFSVSAAQTATLAVPAPRPDRLRLPDLYELLPEVVQAEDQDVVLRAHVPVLHWDTLLHWDTEPYVWDDLIGPEPILRTTLRPIQVELERTAAEIRDLPLLVDVDQAAVEFLPRISAMLGTPLPPASSLGQRAFLRDLVRLYRRRGSPLTFVRFFATLGFRSVLVERYHRRGDGALVTGPQITAATTTVVRDEPVGTLERVRGPYRIRFAFRPVARGSVRVRVFSTSTTTPLVIADDAEGGWSAEATGSIDYGSGRADFTLIDTPELSGTQIVVDYRYLPDPFPDPHRRRWEDRERSSVVSVSFEPIIPTQPFTPDVAARVEHYMEVLRPAHVIFEQVSLRIRAEDDAAPQSLQDTHTLLLLDQVMEAHYWGGHGYEPEGNASAPANLPLSIPHRMGPEWLVHKGKSAPYAMPFLLDGRFHNHVDPGAASTEYQGHGPLDVFSSEVTGDVAPAVDRVSIAKGAGAPASVLVADAALVIDSGPMVGEWQSIATITDEGDHYDVALADDLPMVPEVGVAVALLQPEAVRLDTLDLRPEEHVDLYWIEEAYAGDGTQATFSGFVAGKTPMLEEAVRLRFVIDDEAYEEVDDGTGEFGNTSGLIVSSSINYATGAIDVTFDEAPDDATTIDVAYGQAATVELGEF